MFVAFFNHRSILPIVFFATSACNGGQNGGFQEVIEERTLQGWIAGESWVFSSGAVQTLEDGALQIFLYAEAFDDPCFSQSELNKVVVRIPPDLSQFALDDTTRAVELIEAPADDAPNNRIATIGQVDIETQDENNIFGGLSAYADDDNWVNGQFDGVVCW